MSQTNKSLDAIILMGPFGSGKSYLGRCLRHEGIADYIELEPIIYDLFGKGDEFDLERATAYLRSSYYDQLSSRKRLVAFESTGVVQRPLLLEIMEKYEIALVRVCTPKELCLVRVINRNLTSNNPIEVSKATAFFDYWRDEIAPTYHFALEVDGTDEQSALQAIKLLNTSVF